MCSNPENKLQVAAVTNFSPDSEFLEHQRAVLMGTNDQGCNDGETKNRRPAACPISHAKLAASDGAGATCAHGCTSCVPTFADSTGHEMSHEASCSHGTLIFQYAMG